MLAPEIQQYFDAERQAGALAIALGVLSIGAAASLWFARSPFKTAAWPLVLVGLVELGVGIGLTLRTGPQLERLETELRAAPASAAASELQRMTRVNRSFRVILGVEVLLIVSGALVAFFLRSSSVTWTAVAMGVLVQAAVLLVFDVFAEHRAHVYTRWLSTIAGPVQN